MSATKKSTRLESILEAPSYMIGFKNSNPVTIIPGIITNWTAGVRSNATSIWNVISKKYPSIRISTIIINYKRHGIIACVIHTIVVFYCYNVKVNYKAIYCPNSDFSYFHYALNPKNSKTFCWSNSKNIYNLLSVVHQCTEVRFASLLSGGFTATLTSLIKGHARLFFSRKKSSLPSDFHVIDWKFHPTR